MEARAVAKYMRIAPTKARLVAANVKGLPVEQALGILKFTPKKGAKMIAKVMSSALANAAQMSIDVDSLKVKAVLVDEGPTAKRIMSRAMGRATSIFKRSSHITVILSE